MRSTIPGPSTHVCCSASVASTFSIHRSEATRKLLRKQGHCKHQPRWHTSVAPSAFFGDDVNEPGPHASFLDDAIAGPTAAFTFQRWKAHKASGRYWRHLRGLFSSRTATNLFKPLLTIAASSTTICYFEQLVQEHAAPAWMPSIQVADFPFEQTSFALALLLVFRTDSGYARWNEALNVWREVSSISKELIMDTVALVENASLRNMVGRWTIAYSKCLMIQLQEDKDKAITLGPHLWSNELERLVALQADPGYCLQILTELVLQMRLPEVRENKMMQAIAQLNRLSGTSKRLMQWPIPLAYTRHTSRFMLIWLGLLPLSLWDDLGWLTVGANVGIAYLLLGIEDIGVQIEEPFSMLPLEEITNEVAADINLLLENRMDVQELVQEQMGIHSHRAHGL